MSSPKRFQELTKARRGQKLSSGLLVCSLFTFVSLGFGPWLPKAFGEFRSVVDVGVLGDFYFVRENVNNGQAFGNILFENKFSNSRLWADIGAGGLIGTAGHSYIKVPELYYQAGRFGPIKSFFGRWKTNWSFADDYWNMGLTQPQFLWDGARPEAQGLTGLFVDYKSSSSFRLTGFLSYVFLPTQGATYTLSDGSLISSNPWFVAPVEAVSFSNELFRLNYEINTPAASDVVFRPSLGLRMSYNERNLGAFVNGFYFLKPRNELLLPFQGNLNLTTFNGDVTVTPVVANHQLLGMDVGYRLENAELNLSWIYEGDIVLDAPPEASTFPQLPDQNVFSGALSLDLTPRHQVWFSYIEVVRDPTTALGVYQDSNVNVFSFRNRFEKAFRLEWRGQFLLREAVPQVESRLAWTQSPESQTTWLSGRLAWWLSPSLEVIGQCDLFGSTEEQPDGIDMPSRYQNNDRCLLGGHYAF